MSERLIARMLAPVARAVGNMMARGTVVLANAATKMQTLQIKLLSGEAKDDIEHIEPYGFTAHPKAGAEHVTLFLAGDRSHGITIVVADRRYRLTGLAEGEVAMYTDEGDSIQMKRGRNIVATAGTKITATAPNVEVAASVKVLLTTPLVEATQDVKINGKLDVVGNVTGGALLSIGNVTAFSASTPFSMSGMKTTYNGHTHVENALPGSTQAPTQQI
ncbi:MAG: phage baseplate assembly protein V [Sulfuritalea sp.]|jgi:phage baseplate assembly protein V|nr:phage baseplate assembly protein V [Sulfuritalea sp.]